jgi:hypothetical protein
MVFKGVWCIPRKKNYCISRRRARTGFAPVSITDKKNNSIKSKKIQGAVNAPCSYELFMIKLFAFVMWLAGEINAKLSVYVLVDD